MKLMFTQRLQTTWKEIQQLIHHVYPCQSSSFTEDVVYIYMYPMYGSYKTADTSLFLRRSLIIHRCLGALLSPARRCFNGTDCNKVRLTYVNAVNWKETICRSLLAKHKRMCQNDFHYYIHVQLPFLPYSWFNLKMDPSNCRKGCFQIRPSSNEPWLWEKRLFLFLFNILVDAFNPFTTISVKSDHHRQGSVHR